MKCEVADPLRTVVMGVPGNSHGACLSRINERS